MVILNGILKNTSTVISIALGVISLISIFYAFLQKNKVKRRKRKEQLRAEHLEELIVVLSDSMLDHFVSRDDLASDIEEVIRKFNAEGNAINNKLDRVIRRQDKTEAIRIKNDIVAAADDVRAGLKLSETRFLVLEESYKYYREVLNGNSFLKKEFDYISNNFYRIKHGDNNEKN